MSRYEETLPDGLSSVLTNEWGDASTKAAELL